MTEKDGKTLINDFKIRRIDGLKIDTVIVYEKYKVAEIEAPEGFVLLY